MKVSFNVESGLSIHLSSIIMSSNMLRSESTSSSLSLCSHSEFSSSKGTFTKFSRNSSVNWSMVAGKNDSDSSCSVTRGEISSNGSIDCCPEDPNLYSIIYTPCFLAIYHNGWAIFWRNFVVIFYQPFGVKLFEGRKTKFYLNLLNFFPEGKADSWSGGHTIPSNRFS